MGYMQSTKISGREQEAVSQSALFLGMLSFEISLWGFHPNCDKILWK